MHTKALFAAIALLIGESTARAEMLVFLASSDSGESLYVDRDSLLTLPATNLRRFEAVRLWAVNQVPGGRRVPARTERFQFSFNCIARTSMILSFRNNRPGIRLQDWIAADMGHKYEVPKPGSLQEMAMAFACSGGKLPAAPIKTGPDETEEEGPDSGTSGQNLKQGMNDDR